MSDRTDYRMPDARIDKDAVDPGGSAKRQTHASFFADLNIETFVASENKLLAARHIQLIDELCKGETGGNLYNQDLREWCERGYICHVAWKGPDKRLVGGLAITPGASTVELVGMGVAPEAQGEGVAGKLLRHAIRDCQVRGHRRIELDIRLYDDGLPQAPFRLYRGNGFRLEPGVKAIPIGWGHKSRHLWLHKPDPGGMFRSRVMSLNLATAITPKSNEETPDVP